MDQVLILLSKYLGVFSSFDGDGVTSSMINNYVKQKIVPPPQRKRYAREHMAYFIMICVLKRVLSITQIKEIFDIFHEKYSVSEMYTVFCHELDRVISSLSQKTLPIMAENENESGILALRYAVLSYAFVIFAEINLKNYKGDNENEKQNN